MGLLSSRRRTYSIAVALLVLSWLAIACLWISSPGLQYDEMYFTTGTFPENPGGAVWKLEHDGKSVAVMMMSYMGALKGWMFRGILTFVDPSVITVRLPMLLLAAITIVLTYRLGSTLFDCKTGLIAVILLSTDVTFLLTSKMDWGPVVIQRLCLVAGVLFIVIGGKSRKDGHVAAGLFLFGLALFDKLTFVWILAGLLTAFFMTYRRILLERSTWKHISFYLLAFTLPASPALYYRIFIGTPDKTLIETHSTHLWEKYGMLYQSLDGTVLSGPVSFQSADNPAPARDFATQALYWLSPDEPWVTSWFRPAVIVALLSFPLTLFLPGGRSRAFLLLFCVFAWIPMLLTERGGSVHHLTLVYPFPHLFVAASFVSLAELTSKATGRKLALGLLFMTTALIAQANVKNVVHKTKEVVRFGGQPTWTEAIFALHQFLDSRPEPQILIGDWGIEHQLVFLSNNTMPLTSIANAGPEDEQALRSTASRLEQPGTLVVRYMSKEMSQSPMMHDLANDAARLAGVRLRSLQTIRDRQGREMYQVYSTQPVVPGAAPPAVND